jgi:SAM-dependent methyltransferase
MVPAMATQWSEQQVRALIAEGGFRYQNIELPYGLSTGGSDRSPTARAIFPDDMTGKSVLDLGCKFGFFCFEALKRGAARAVGVDVDPDSLDRARRLADCLGLPARFEMFDIEAQPLVEHFDYVLCLNLLHHLHNPLAALERLAAVTDERLILESATMGRHDRRKLRLSPFEAVLLRRRPVLYASRNGTSDKRNVQKFFVTPTALENLLRFQSNAFARVDTLPSDHKDRYISVAWRRRIGELVVVAGSPGSGSVELAEQLARGAAPELAAAAGLGDAARLGESAGWQVVDANRLTELCEPAAPRLILHYDILRPHRRSAKTHARDEAMDVLGCARRVTFVTLWRAPDELRRRFEAQPMSFATRRGWFFEGRRHQELRVELADPRALPGHYRRWFEFTRQVGARHFVVSPDAEPRIASLADWERSPHGRAPGTAAGA